MGQAAVLHLGCKVNRVEADSYERLLAELGFEPAPVPLADIVIINTCTVTGAADKKARKATNGALRDNPQAPIIVTGCGAVVNAEQFGRLSPRVEVVTPGEIVAYLRQWAAHQPSEERVKSTPPKLSGLTRPSVKIQDGCDNRCTYCIVWAARGPSRSLPVEEVKAEVAAELARGAAEIVLAGINLGAYDDQGRKLADLLRELLRLLPAHTRLRLSSIEPDFVTDDLTNVIAESDGRICRHLHLPLQSGSNRVLAAMDRHYTADEFIELVDRLRVAMPTLSLSTDVIVGFPGERDDDFEATLATARRCGFSRVHQFSYSARPSTPAASYAGVVAPETMHERACELRRLGEALATADLERRYGTREAVLIEALGRWRTESYHELRGNPQAVAGNVGALVDVVIDPVVLGL